MTSLDWSTSRDGYYSAVVGHLKGHATDRLKQLAMDSGAQRQVAELACQQLPPEAQARCIESLVSVGKITQGVGTALGAEVREAHQDLQGILEDPAAVVEGAITMATNPTLVKEQAASLKDDALDCAKAAREAFANRDLKKIAELTTHAGLLLVPFGKAFKAAKAAEEVSIASHAAAIGARVKVTTDTVRGTGCTSSVSQDAQGQTHLHTTLTVETPLLNGETSGTIEVY